MVKKRLEVLIVDDNQIMVEGYKSILKGYPRSPFLFSIRAFGYYGEPLLNKSNPNPIDLIILEIAQTFIPEENKEVGSIENFSQKLKKVLPETKILIITKVTDRYEIYSYIKKINPHGFLLKSEIDSDTLLQAIQIIYKGNKYYSSSIIEILQDQLQWSGNIDDIDRNILHHISKGIKTKDLVTIIPLSLAGIEKRKRKLRAILEVEPKNEKLLIKRATDLGII